MNIVKIANCKGVPGTMGCLAYTRDKGQAVLLSSWHVLYGNEATTGDKVWQVHEKFPRKNLEIVGTVLRGHLGMLRFYNWEVYVDCAIALFGKGVRQATEIYKDLLPINGHEVAQIGDEVIKYGAYSGMTKGIIIENKHTCPTTAGGKAFQTQSQLLIRSENGKSFAAAGDSGALILNKANKAVGLLWGTNHLGEGLACPIAPVLSVLNIELKIDQ